MAASSIARRGTAEPPSELPFLGEEGFIYQGEGDLDGVGTASVDAWDTVLSPRLSTGLTYALNERWEISAGGGLIGVEYRASDTLSGSLGVAVISQIENDATVAPSVGLRWLPAPRAEPFAWAPCRRAAAQVQPPRCRTGSPIP